MLTVSEKLFEDYCILRGYSFNRTEIVAGEGRFSDYEFQTPRGTVICKVKEILPNADNKAFDERLVKYRYADSSRAIGKRARPALTAASGQLRRFRDDPRPCIAVLFDTTYHHHLSPQDIDAAMFGDPFVLFSTNPAGHQSDFAQTN
jgi:hypothetical protein